MREMEIKMNVHHENTGECAKCEEIFKRYPDFYQPLKDWFRARQLEDPRVHISCAGRGKAEQEACVANKTSEAHYPKSGHNFSAAIDCFFIMAPGAPASWPQELFDKVLLPKLTEEINWYGHPRIRAMTLAQRRQAGLYYELPHFEWKAWREMAKRAELKETDGGVNVKPT